VSPAATAYVALADVALHRGQLADAEGWLEQAERVLQRFTEPTTAMMLYTDRAFLESARGRHEAAMTAQRAADSIQRGLATRRLLATPAQAVKLLTLVRVGDTERVERALDGMDEDVRATTVMRVVQATLRLAQDDPERAAAALAPIFDGASPIEFSRW